MTTTAASTSVDWPSRSIAFLGPVGTFSEQALHSQADLSQAKLVPMPSFSAVLTAVETGSVDLGFVAIENAIEGTVNVNQDTLAFDLDLLVQREVVVPVHLDLMARPGVRLDQITRGGPSPQALAQCRRFLARELPMVEAEASNSTADAARALSQHHDPHGAAIAPGRAAEVYGLDVLAHAIEDHDGNETRFVLVGREGIPAATGHDKTSIVVFQRSDEPGSLLTILQEFAARGINLTKLESRPTGRGLGDYCFLIDLEGHLSDEVVADALRSLKAKQADVKFLGSYPMAGEHGPAVRREVEESRLRAAGGLDGLRAQGEPACRGPSRPARASGGLSAARADGAPRIQACRPDGRGRGERGRRQPGGSDEWKRRVVRPRETLTGGPGRRPRPRSWPGPSPGSSPATARWSRPSGRSTWRSPTASSSASWGRRAAASRRSCASSPAW